MIYILFRRLMYYLLPPTTRKKADASLMLRTKWWYYLIKPMEDLMSSFHNARIDYIIRSNVTSQIVVLEWYLKRQIDDGIYLSKPVDRGVFVSLSNESILTSLEVGLEGSSEPGVFIGLLSEVIAYQLVVNIPNDLIDNQIEQIKIILKQYLFANTNYVIKKI